MFEKSELDLVKETDSNEKYLGYLRMYWCGGLWNHRFFDIKNDTAQFGGITGLEQREIDELNIVLKEINERWSSGCDYKMEKDLADLVPDNVPEKRYLLVADGIFLNYQLMIDTTYGNGDYPIRIYLFKKMKAT